MENCTNNFRPTFKAQLENNGLREVIYKDSLTLITVTYGHGLTVTFCIWSMNKHNGKIMVLCDMLLCSLVMGYHCSIWTFSTFRVEGCAVIGTEVGTELLQLRLQANWFTHSHSSSCPFLIFISISPYTAHSFNLKMETAGSSKHLYPSANLLGVTTLRTTLWILTTVRTRTSQSQWQIIDSSLERKARVQSDKLK
jgi:hypothetical protein